MLLNHADDVFSYYPDIENLRQSPNNIDKQNIKTLTQNLANPRLLDSVGHDVTSVDDIVCRTQLPIAEVLSQLSTLELSGYVQQTAGGYTRIKGAIMFDILMYLFESLIHNESEFHYDQEELTEELVRAGFHHDEIYKALLWLGSWLPYKNLSKRHI